MRRTMDKQSITTLTLGAMSREKGDTTAGCQLKLGMAYAEGAFVPRNYIEAYKWVSLAEAQGQKVPNKFWEKLEARMSRKQVAEAQRLAGEWWEEFME